MSNKRFSFNKLLQKMPSSVVFKGARITTQVFWNLLLLFIIVIVSLGFFVGGAGAGYFASLIKDEPIRSYEEMERDIYNYEEATEVYFANDILLGDMPSPLERREVTLDEISQYVKDAVIATEDEYFYEHKGIVPKAILRALYQDFSNANTQTGGSTITQQLIKNQLLTSEVTHDRKATEILLAVRLENFFDKDDILEAYLNVIPYGRNSTGRQVAGIQAAALGVFGVDAKDLNLPQAAYLAGLPQSPFAYTPFTSEGTMKENIDAGLKRMETVLGRMLANESITKAEYEEALTYDIRGKLIPPKRGSYADYPHITDEVRRRAEVALAKALMQRDDIDLEKIEDDDQRNLTKNRYEEEAARTLHRSGYRIYTTIDKDIYDAQQKVVQEFPYYAGVITDTVITDDGEEIKKEFQEQVSSMIIENKTGKIISFVPNSAKDFQDHQFNYATQSKRHTGSTMKPLLTYAIGFETGVLQPGYITPDTPYNYASSGKPVSNWDNKHLGLMTARVALQISRNVPAVREYTKIPHEIAQEALINYGFQPYFLGGEPFESTALGTLGMPVEANTSAFTTFANGGKRKEAYMIERIETSDGQVIYEHEEVEHEVFSEQTAYLMIDMMRDVMKSPGTGAGIPRQLNFSSDLIGKTGTSNGVSDSLFVGLNPNFTMGLWLGYEEERFRIPNRSHGYSYGQRTQMLWARLANAVYEINPEFMAPKERFQAPSGIVTQSICGISGKLPSDLCREAGLVTTDIFNAKYIPTEVDDSLERVNYVRVDESLYKALETTPIEFTNEGISVKEEYFDFAGEDISKYIPEDWETIIPDEEAPDNGKTPDALKSVVANDKGITWSEHHEGDVIGYRVYYSPQSDVDFTHIANVKWDEEFQYSGTNGAYYVLAVDVAGRESEPSDIIIVGKYEEIDDEINDDIDEDEETDIEDPDEDDIVTPPDNNNGENGNNDNNSGNDSNENNGTGNNENEENNSSNRNNAINEDGIRGRKK